MNNIKKPKTEEFYLGRHSEYQEKFNLTKYYYNEEIIKLKNIIETKLII